MGVFEGIGCGMVFLAKRSPSSGGCEVSGTRGKSIWVVAGRGERYETAVGSPMFLLWRRILVFSWVGIVY